MEDERHQTTKAIFRKARREFCRGRFLPRENKVTSLRQHLLRAVKDYMTRC
jgi:hypothetical protein